MSKVLMIIPPARFRDEELIITREELEKNGHTEYYKKGLRTKVIFSQKGGYQGMPLYSFFKANKDTMNEHIFITERLSVIIPSAIQGSKIL
jgi:hypothetical protein